MIVTLSNSQWTNLGNGFYTTFLRSYSNNMIQLAVSVTAPTENQFYVIPNESVLVENNGVNVWVKGLAGNTLWVGDQDNSKVKTYQVADLPTDLLTDPISNVAGAKRLRVDVSQSGFWNGHQFELARKITAPIVYRFVCPVPFILQKQELTCSEGDIEMFAWSGTDVTPGGTWVTVPTFKRNETVSSYVQKAVISSGGTLTVNNPNNYRDYSRVRTSNATAQQITIGGQVSDERFHNPGTYYIQLSGTASIGSYHLVWEER